MDSSKLRLNEIERVIQTADGLIFCETWLQSDADIPEILQQNFHCFSLHRVKRTKYGRPSGGILICIRKIYQNVSLHSVHEDAGIIWIKFSAPQNGTDMFLAGCYFSPSDAVLWKLNNINPFQMLHDDLTEISALGNYIITGDLNARTGNEPDYLEMEYVEGIISTGDPVLREVLSMFDTTAAYNIPKRRSCDLKINEFGRLLLELCSNSGSCILNGRLDGDTDGAHTFASKSIEGLSLVDYFISSPSVFFKPDGPALPDSNLTVCSDNIYMTASDHFPVMLCIPHGTVPMLASKSCTKQRRRRKNNNGSTQKKWTWDDAVHTQYSEELISGPASHTLADIFRYESTDYISMIDSLKTSLNQAANFAGLKQKNMFSATASKKFSNRAIGPWYDMTCILSQRKIKNATSGAARYRAMQSYKRVVSRAKLRYSRGREAKLQELLKHNPREFWRIMKSDFGATAGTFTSKQLHDYYCSLRQPSTYVMPPDYIPAFTAADLGRERDRSLDRAFIINDTIAAMECLKNRKTADAEGNIAELLTKAYDTTNGSFLLAPHLTHIINSIFLSGEFPTSESMGMIISIYKGKGDTSDCNNYRGITIISVLSKLYATMINNRLSAWRLAKMDRRARGQGGFLKDHRTTDHIFILQHLIDKSYADKKPLYTCFVDLSKAFDTISRAKLWERLADLGIRGRMLDALKAYYDDVRECVKSGDGLTDYFKSSMGVKQGCPLSPTLFGLYIDAAEDFICSNLDGGGSVQIFSNKVPLLLYADDIVFLASSEQELQKIMDIFSDFCYKYYLTVNLKKTQVVIFSKARKAQTVNITYRGIPVPRIDKYTYLGIVFQEKFGAKFGGLQMLAVAKRALFSLERKLRSENITAPSMIIQMFDSLIAPILLYGSEVWGCYTNNAEADVFYLGFLKNLFRVPKGTNSDIILAEAGRLSFHVKIWESQARYWERLTNINDNTRIIDMAFTENFMMEGMELDCWSKHSLKGLERLGMPLYPGSNSVSRSSISVKTVREVCTKKLTDSIKQPCKLAVTDHRDFYSHDSYVHAEGERCRSYARWFWNNGRNEVMNMRDIQLRNELIRFRLGAHGLGVVRGAWDNTDRRNRICRCCRTGVIEDEVHMIFECSLYNNIRSRFRDLFSEWTIHSDEIMITIAIDDPDNMMRVFFRQQNIYKVAKFIVACRETKQGAGFICPPHRQ